jgi:ParE toxin of type II toxin-antitoxin system, parDE
VKAIFHPGALADLRNQAHYLEQQNASEEVLRGLFEAIRLAKEKIEQNPRTWSFIPGTKRVRKVQVPRFGMQVVYAIKGDGVPLIIELIGPGVQPRWVERL